MLKTTRISSFDELRSIKDEWDRLLGHNHTQMVFLTHEWVTKWWKHFGRGNELMVLLVKENGKLVCIAPLMIRKSRTLLWSRRTIQFIGTPLSDYCDFIVPRGEKKPLKAIYQYLFDNKRSWTKINLEEIPEKSPTLRMSEKILKGMIKLYDISFSNKCLSANFKDMSEKEIKKLLRKRDIQRNMNYFKDKGELVYQEAKSPSERNEALKTLFDQHIKAWDEKKTLSMFRDSKCQEFFIDVSKELLPKGKISVWTLKCDKQMVAVQLGFNYDKTYLEYCRSHDIDYTVKGPGMILSSRVMEHYFNNDYDKVDFSRGAHPYKYRFSNETSINKAITIDKRILGYFLNKMYNNVKGYIMRRERLHHVINTWKNKIMYRKKSPMI